MRTRGARPAATVVAVAVTALVGVAVLLSACTRSGPAASPRARGSASKQAASLGPISTTGGDPATLRPSASASGSNARSGHPSSASGVAPAGGGSSSARGARLVPPDGANPSGVICTYVPQADVQAILAGASTGQENDLQADAVSYCNFSQSPYGTVSVGVKRMESPAAAASQVRAKYDENAGQPGQDLQAATVDGEFGFELSSATPLQNGMTLYAVNGQGSHGQWYVAIQYYAHRPCSQSAMQHLLAAVLATVPR